MDRRRWGCSPRSAMPKSMDPMPLRGAHRSISRRGLASRGTAGREMPIEEVPPPGRRMYPRGFPGEWKRHGRLPVQPILDGGGRRPIGDRHRCDPTRRERLAGPGRRPEVVLRELRRAERDSARCEPVVPGPQGPEADLGVGLPAGQRGRGDGRPRGPADRSWVGSSPGTEVPAAGRSDGRTQGPGAVRTRACRSCPPRRSSVRRRTRSRRGPGPGQTRGPAPDGQP